MESNDILTYDAFVRSCPSHTVLETLANKWAYLIVIALRPGTQRYSDLQKRIGGISAKMLTQTLRRLERDGLVSRRIYPVVPPHVDYDLTPLGQDLAALMDAVRIWGEAHVPQIEAARAAYDAGAQAR